MARVLVVDDEPDLLLMLRMAIEDAGHEVVLAADGEMALERLDKGGIDVVVLDVMMPVMDGWAVLGALGRRDSAPPVVVLSARGRQEDVDRARSLGAAEYLVKPTPLDDVVAAVERLAGDAP